MGKKVLEHLDKIIAGAIILCCLALIGSRLLSNPEQEVKHDDIEKQLKDVSRAMNGDKTRLPNKPEPEPPPVYAETFMQRMKRTERPVNAETVAWAMNPIPPFKPGTQLVPPPTYVYAELYPPSIAVAGTWIGKAVLKVGFSKADKLCQVRQLHVFRKPKDAKKEDQEERLFFIEEAADGKHTVPPGVSGAGGEFEIPVEGLPVKTPFQYRVRVAAKFLKTTIVDNRVREVVPPKVGVTALKDDWYATDYTQPVEITLPGDVQVKLAGVLLDDGQANFKIRKWLPQLNRWEETTVFNIGKGQAIKAEKPMRLQEGGELVKVAMDSRLVLVALREEPQPPKIVPRTVYEKDPKTGQMVKKVIEVPIAQPPIKVVDVRDIDTQQVHKLPQGSDWWPVLPLAAPAPAPAPKAAPAPVGAAPVDRKAAEEPKGVEAGLAPR